MSLHSSAEGGRRQKQLFNFLRGQDFPLEENTTSTKIKSVTCTLIHESGPLERRGEVYTQFQSLSPKDVLYYTTYWEGK